MTFTNNSSVNITYTCKSAGKDEGSSSDDNLALEVTSNVLKGYLDASPSSPITVPAKNVKYICDYEGSFVKGCAKFLTLKAKNDIMKLSFYR